MQSYLTLRYQFAVKAQINKLALPKLFLLVGNQLTAASKKKGKKAIAFSSAAELTARLMYEYIQQKPDNFVSKGNITSKKEFKEKFYVELRDFNTNGVVSAHNGIPLSSLRNDKTNLINFIHKNEVIINSEQLKKDKQSLLAVYKKIFVR